MKMPDQGIKELNQVPVEQASTEIKRKTLAQCWAMYISQGFVLWTEHLLTKILFHADIIGLSVMPQAWKICGLYKFL